MDVNRAEYGVNTYRYFEALREGNATLEQIGDRQYVLVVDGNDTEDPVEAIRQILPGYEHIKMILLYAREDDETLHKYAERVALYAPELTMFTARDPQRHVTRNAVINTLLSRRQIPDASEVGHILMELRMPGLFTETYDKAANLRNYVMVRFFEYASSESAKGEDRPWMYLLQSALSYYGCKNTVRKRFLPPETAQTNGDVERFEEWRDGFQKIQSAKEISYQAYRVQMRNQYATHHGNIKPEAFYTAMSKHYGYYTQEYVKSFYSAMDVTHNKCSRDCMIDFGIYMECGLAEINRMLMETNNAFVYPLSSWQNEREYAQKIAKAART